MKNELKRERQGEGERERERERGRETEGKGRGERREGGRKAESVYKRKKLRD